MTLTDVTGVRRDASAPDTTLDVRVLTLTGLLVPSLAGMRSRAAPRACHVDDARRRQGQRFCTVADVVRAGP
jgi:hypothetical protein